MKLKFGLVGLPNIGKSTLFNVLTGSNSPAFNFPFCTIKPTIGIVPVPDDRLLTLSKIFKSKRITPATIEFIDIAGLMKGASHGEGLGNQFLMNIREVSAIGHVVRCFKDDSVSHVNNAIDPVEDINIVESELILSDLDVCEKALIRIMKANKKKASPILKDNISVLKKCCTYLENGCMLRQIHLVKKEINILRSLDLLTLKPTIYIANTNDNSKKYLGAFYKKTTGQKSLEVSLHNIKHIRKKEHSLKLNQVIHTAYSLLGLQTYFTSGPKETRAWTILSGSNAVQASRKIHTDIQKGFIRAKVIAYQDLLNYSSEKNVRGAGKLRTEGKDYIIKDGDVIEFLFNN